MPLILELCNDADFPRAFAVMSAAFESPDHSYPHTLFPALTSAASRAAGAKRIRPISKEDKYTRPSGEIIAIAKWNIYDKGVVPDEENLDGPWWDDGPDTKEYAQELYRVYLQDRRKAIRNSGGMLC
ncbi:hypothetical protein MMC14_006902, partial [Varicellaria rhodocarpa]|nr:hypothetical protein [Varicellaria rhodocarpa]